MGAEYTLIIKNDDITNEEWRLYYCDDINSSYSPWNTYLKGNDFSEEKRLKTLKEVCDLQDKRKLIEDELERKMNNQPYIHIAECSFLSAGIFGTALPPVVLDIGKALKSDIENAKVINNEIVDIVRKAFEKDNSEWELHSTKEQVIAFLEKYKGRKVYAQAW